MFTSKVPKPKISETFTLVDRGSSSFTKSGKPNVSESWVKVNLETAPASNIADIAEADFAIVDNSNTIPNVSE